jgi:hypothetical protein
VQFFHTFPSSPLFLFDILSVDRIVTVKTHPPLVEADINRKQLASPSDTDHLYYSYSRQPASSIPETVIE